MKTIVICGATATGKSDLAVALAKEIGAEIINADSMQLYRGMDIGTAKLTLAERDGIEHHLLDVLDVTEDATVAWYQEQARKEDLRDSRTQKPCGNRWWYRPLHKGDFG